MMVRAETTTTCTAGMDTYPLDQVHRIANDTNSALYMDKPGYCLNGNKIDTTFVFHVANTLYCIE